MNEDVKEEPKRVTIDIVDGAINVNHSMPHHEFLGLIHTLLLHENVNTIKPHIFNIVREFEQVQEGNSEELRATQKEVKEHYLRLQQLSQDIGSNQIKDEHGAFLGQMTGMLHVLNQYGIKIEGVNVE